MTNRFYSLKTIFSKHLNINKLKSTINKDEVYYYNKDLIYNNDLESSSKKIKQYKKKINKILNYNSFIYFK